MQSTDIYLDTTTANVTATPDGGVIVWFDPVGHIRLDPDVVAKVVAADRGRRTEAVAS